MPIKFAVLLIAILALTCGGPKELSDEERAKLDPRLIELLNSSSVSDAAYDVSMRPDGQKEYGVIIRTNNTDALRTIGIQVQSVFGDVVTARLTTDELRKVVALQSVRAVQNSGRNIPH